MRHDPVRPLTPVGPRHDFEPPPEHGRLRRTGVATPIERRRAARFALRTGATLATALVAVPLAVTTVTPVLATDPFLLWLGALAAARAGPSVGGRLVRGRE